MAALEEAARQRGFARLRLDCTTTARRFYLSPGHLAVDGQGSKMEKPLEQGPTAPV